MFPHSFYPGAYFAPTYYPPVAAVVPILPTGGGWKLVANLQAQWLRREDEELIIIHGRLSQP